MPRAPKLQRSVSPTPLPGFRRQAAETFASAGGVVAEAQANFGRELQGSLTTLADIKLRADADAAATESMTIRKRFNDLDHVLLQSTDRGLLNKTGKEPMELLAKYLEEWDTTADEMIASEIKTQGGRDFFAEEKERRRDAFLNRSSSHSSQQMRVYRGQELNALITSTVNAGAAAADPRDPRAAGAVAFHLQSIDDAIDANAQQLGFGAETVAQMKREARSTLHTNAVERLLSTPGKERDARDYFEEVEDQITDEASKSRLRSQLKRNATDSIAFDAANDIWEQGAPAATDDTTPIEIDKLEAEARKRFKDDPEAYRAASAYLRDRKQGVEDGRRQRQSVRDSAIYGAILQGATISQVRQLPEFREAKGEDQVKIIDYLEREADRAEARRASTESRAYTRAQRREQELENAGWGKYFELSDPNVLSTKTRGEIMAELPTLGRDHVNRLLTDKEALDRNAAAVQSSTMDREIYKDAAYNAGLNWIYNTPAQLDEAEKAQAGKLLTAMETEVQRQAAAKGRRLTLDEQRDVAQKIVDKQLMLDVFGPDKRRIAATLQEDEVGVAYVPLADVSPDFRTRAANILRGLPRGTTGTLSFEVSQPTNDELLQTHRARVQRAAALEMLGRPRAEWVKVLEGKE